MPGERPWFIYKNRPFLESKIAMIEYRYPYSCLHLQNRIFENISKAGTEQLHSFRGKQHQAELLSSDGARASRPQRTPGTQNPARFSHILFQPACICYRIEMFVN
jgi:hypothetical protein